MDDNSQNQPSEGFLSKFSKSFSELWANDKIFLIVFGILLLIIKFRSILIDILLKDSKDILDNAKKKDDQLASQENKAKEDADALVKKAQEEPNNQDPVDKDWYKKS